MRISATGRKTSREAAPSVHPNPPFRSAGFTLLEIMVVVLIIGILLSVFTLSVGSFTEDQGAEDARRMRILVEMASEEAAMQGREIGMTFYQHGYEFAWRQILEDEEGQRYIQWAPVDNDRLLRARDLGEDLSIDLELGGEEIILLYERDSEAEYQPHVYLMSSGEIEPAFTARVRPAFQSLGYILSAEDNGQLAIRNESAPESDLVTAND